MVACETSCGKRELQRALLLEDDVCATTEVVAAEATPAPDATGTAAEDDADCHFIAATDVQVIDAPAEESQRAQGLVEVDDEGLP